MCAQDSSQPAPRKPYRTPHLTLIGTVAELTGGGAGSASDGHGGVQMAKPNRRP